MPVSTPNGHCEWCDLVTVSQLGTGARARPGSVRNTLTAGGLVARQNSSFVAQKIEIASSEVERLGGESARRNRDSTRATRLRLISVPLVSLSPSPLSNAFQNQRRAEPQAYTGTPCPGALPVP